MSIQSWEGVGASDQRLANSINDLALHPALVDLGLILLGKDEVTESFSTVIGHNWPHCPAYLSDLYKYPNSASPLHQRNGLSRWIVGKRRKN